MASRERYEFVQVFHDPWLLRPNLFKPIMIPNQHQFHLKVCDLMTVYGDWDWHKVNSTLWKVDQHEVKRIPVGNGTGKDQVT